MKIYAIGDLHLNGNADKPMDVFGSAWIDHPTHIGQQWNALVEEDDLVLIPGDISWAMQLKDALGDICFIGDLPGKKLLLRGNHDYWWSSLAKVRAALPANCFALQNDAFTFNGVTICGSRGWVCPGSVAYDENKDRAIYERELIRLRMSLERAPKENRKLMMLHYPPFNEKRIPSGFTLLAEEFGVEAIIYGHLHHKACHYAFEGTRNGIEYILCSADHINFTPKLITETDVG